MKTHYKLISLLLLASVVTNHSLAQSFSTTFAVPDVKKLGQVFLVSFTTKKDSPVFVLVTKRITPKPLSQDTVYLNYMSKSIFKVSVEAQLVKIQDTAFESRNHIAIDTILDNVYKRYTSQQTKIKAKADTAAIQYGMDEYYGLTREQNTQLQEKFKKFYQYQKKKHDLKYNAPSWFCNNSSNTKYWNAPLNNKINKETTLNKESPSQKDDKKDNSSTGNKKIDDSNHTNNQNPIPKKEHKKDTLPRLKDSTSNHQVTRHHAYTIYKDSLIKIAHDIKDLKSNRKFQISLVGNGNVISSFKQSQQSQISGGFGIMALMPNHIEFIGAFTISQSSDTISSVGKSNDFGASLLMPGMRKFSLMTSYRKRQLWPTAYSNFWKKIGIAWNVNLTPYNWSTTIRKTNSASDSTITARVIPLAMDLMLPFNWVNVYENGQEITIATDVGITGRYLMGNISAEERNLFLGNNSTFYVGAIAGIYIKFNGLHFKFYVPYLFKNSKDGVDGLTGGQVYAFMTFTANIIGSNSIQSLFKKTN